MFSNASQIIFHINILIKLLAIEIICTIFVVDQNRRKIRINQKLLKYLRNM